MDLTARAEARTRRLLLLSAAAGLAGLSFVTTSGSWAVLVAFLLVAGLALLQRRGLPALQAPAALGLAPASRRRLQLAIRTGTHLTGPDEPLALDLALRQRSALRLLAPVAAASTITAALTALALPLMAITAAAQAALLGLVVLPRLRRATRYLNRSEVAAR